MKRRSGVKKQQRLQVVLLGVCILALFLYVLFVTRPKITVYVIKDECGPIGGIISHPINDGDSCNNICRAQCLSWEQEFHSSEFIVNEPCNTCKCDCKS